jgi:aryl-alcohol dehydrogenase-like predicted oxidoreductase
MPLVEMLNDIASRKGASTVQIALAWLLAQKPFIVPIPGMDTLEYIEDNIKSVDLSLTSDDLQEIEDRLANIAIQGDRLSKELLSLSED